MPYIYWWHYHFLRNSWGTPWICVQRFRECGLKLKPSKCHFLQERIKYLGLIVCSAGVEADPDKLEAVQIKYGRHIGWEMDLSFNRYLPLPTQDSPQNLRSIRPGVPDLSSWNKIQDGCHGGHIGWATGLIFNRYPPLTTQDSTRKSQNNLTRRSSLIIRKPNSRWLPWQPYQLSDGSDFQ